MLELKDIKKKYQIGDHETIAIDGISVAFREKEFVAILGPSGSGKTTCLNIIGGLDRYDSGELVIKGKHTSNFKESDWDAYRNNSIGFVFQSYNLITHIGIVDNVELGMTLSGVSKAEKHRRAVEVLTRVGLEDHLHKNPNQLSGGQMQRVAIARALANDPEILLCDEPTGALDSGTSTQIMELIQELSSDRLVIMVTHNPEIAETYADRIIKFEDGKIASDTHPHQERPKPDMFKLKKTSMSFVTALGLSFNNIKTKKLRTFLTAFASSIGIIGIALILSLSTGFQLQIDKFQSETLAESPIIISQTAMSMDSDDMQEMREKIRSNRADRIEYTDAQEIYPYDPELNSVMHTNNFTDGYLEYLEKIDPQYCGSIGYMRVANMNLLRKVGDEIKPVSISTGMGGGGGMMNMSLSSYPIQLNKNEESYLEKNYDLLAGEYPTETTDVVLVVDNYNRLTVGTLNNLAIDTEDVASIAFDDIIGIEMKIIPNNAYFTTTDYGTFMPSSDFEVMYENDTNITVRVSGILRLKEEVTIGIIGSGVAYSDSLMQMVINDATESDIIKAQLDSDTSVITMEQLDETGKQNFISYLGGNPVPYVIMVYPTNFDGKEKVLEYLDDFNTGKEYDDMIIYTDLAATVVDMSSGIVDGITIVLIAFASISLIVSLIMICIITYTSVLERTKEIGILKALGARKKDITRVFDAETFIIGVFSGCIGVVFAGLLTIPANIIIEDMTTLANVAQLQITHAVLLVIVSTLLTIIGGHVPALMASRKDAVEALRSE
jgi:ABC-type antimicrobial peptide transport system, ATPase component